MKLLRKIILSSLLLFLTVMTVNAQTKRQKEKAQKEVDNLTVALELNEEQAAKVYDIQLESYVKLSVLSKSAKAGDITKEEQKTQAKQIRKQSRTAIIDALGDELGKAYMRGLKKSGKTTKTPKKKVEKVAKKSKKVKKTKKGKKNRAEERAMEETNKLKAALDLNEEQAAKIHETHIATYSKVRELAAAVKAGDMTKEERKVQNKALWKENIAKIETILGKSLHQKYRAYRKAQRKAKKNK